MKLWIFFVAEGLEKTGKYFFVECSQRSSPNSNRNVNPDLNMSTLIKCLSKARFNSYPTGKDKKSLPLRESPLTQVLSTVLKPGQMVTFIGNISTAQRHYNESYTTCSDVNTIHVADDRILSSGGKSTVASTTTKKTAVSSTTKIQKKVKKSKRKKKVRNEESTAEKKSIATTKKHKEEINVRPIRKENPELLKHEMRLPIVARPSR